VRTCWILAPNESRNGDEEQGRQRNGAHRLAMSVLPEWTTRDTSSPLQVLIAVLSMHLDNSIVQGLFAAGS
jgi:hypothetical protein